MSKKLKNLGFVIENRLHTVNTNGLGDAGTALFLRNFTSCGQWPWALAALLDANWLWLCPVSLSTKTLSVNFSGLYYWFWLLKQINKEKTLWIMLSKFSVDSLPNIFTMKIFIIYIYSYRSHTFTLHLFLKTWTKNKLIVYRY